MSRYHEVYRSWEANPEAFWAKAAAEIDWYEPWRRTFETVGGLDRWFTGASCNTCYNAVDRHVERGRGGQKALVHDSPVTGTRTSLTYAELLDEVATFAAVLEDLGTRKGDRVIIYMPMVPQAVIAMLAAARIGAIHSVVFGGFAAQELAARIDDARPHLLLLASCGIEPRGVVEYKPLVEKALGVARHRPEACVVLQRPQCKAMLAAGDLDWNELVTAARASRRQAQCVPVAATDPLYILYTSGTTGRPKGIVRDNGGHMVALKWSMANIYDVKPGEVFWAASDIGWVVGHSYVVYGPLLHGCTSIVYEGKPVGTPDAGAFWRVVGEHGVAALFTAPTAFRAIKKEDPAGELVGRYDLGRFRTLFLAGERADPDTVRWAEQKLKVPVIDHWWQTETGWSIAANPVGLGMLPVKHGSPTVAMPGYEIAVLDETASAVAPGKLGAICIKLPLPPGSLPTLWQNEERFRESYLSRFPGYYETADAGYTDDDGYLYIMARTDDIINVAGHRLLTGGMEEVLAGHPDVAECAVIGMADDLKGQVPAGFVVLKAGVDRAAPAIENECVQLVRDRIGPVASFRTAMVVPRLPKTRSGKILRSTMRSIADGTDWKMPATIDDPAILDEIAAALTARGIGQKVREG